MKVTKKKKSFYRKNSRMHKRMTDEESTRNERKLWEKKHVVKYSDGTRQNKLQNFITSPWMINKEIIEYPILHFEVQRDI